MSYIYLCIMVNDLCAYVLLCMSATVTVMNCYQHVYNILCSIHCGSNPEIMHMPVVREVSSLLVSFSRGRYYW